METLVCLEAGVGGREQVLRSCVADPSAALGDEMMFSFCIYRFSFELQMSFAQSIARDVEYCSTDVQAHAHLLHRSRGSEAQMYWV